MFLPEMSSVDNSIQRNIEFKGYANGSYIEDGEMRNMKNLCSTAYPSLSQRSARGLYSDSVTRPYNILAWKEKLAWIDGDEFYYAGEKKAVLQSAGEHILAGINSRLCIFPDKICYSITEDRIEKLDAFFETGDLAEGTYIHVTSNSINIPGADFSDFAYDDAVTLCGFTTNTNNNISAKIVSVEGSVLTFPDNSFDIPEEFMEQDYYEEYGNIRIERTVPDMDFVVESNNRLWGCKGNTIYSCKLGDPKNWNDFSAISNASYAVEVGTDGDFTGIAVHATHIAFFKEDYIHKLYGNNKPSSYQIVTIRCLGLQQGCHKSVQDIDSVIYYKSREGIVAYTGDYPVLITQNFKHQYTDAVAGTDLMKYYVSMKRKDGIWDFFAYDLIRKMWHLEDNTHAAMFTCLKGKLLYIDADAGKIYKVKGDGDDILPEDEKIDWMAEFGPYDELLENNKIYSRIQMRFQMEELAEMTVSINVDGKGFEKVYHLVTDKSRSMYLPIIPRRCDKFSIRLEGKGRTRIDSMVRVCRQGSVIK